MMVLGWALIGLLSAQPQHVSARELYYRAMGEVRAGSAERAFVILQELIERFPDDAFAEHALLEQARIAEEVFLEPRRALELYRTLADKYPSSRLVRRARARMEFLGGHLDQGEAALASYLRIQQESLHIPAEETAARMERLLLEHPDFSLRPEGLFWLGSTLAREGLRERAREKLEELICAYPQHQAAGMALGLLGNLAQEDGDLAAAEAAYRRLIGLADEKWQQTGQDALRRLDKLRWQRRAIAAAAVLWGLLSLGLWTLLFLRLRAGRLRLPRMLCPPAEALLYLLVMSALAIWAGSGAQQTTRALLWLGGMIFLVLVPNGWLLRSFTPRGGYLLLWLAGLTAACAAALVASVGLAGMTGQVLHTLEFGAH